MMFHRAKVARNQDMSVCLSQRKPATKRRHGGGELKKAIYKIELATSTEGIAYSGVPNRIIWQEAQGLQKRFARASIAESHWRELFRRTRRNGPRSLSSRSPFHRLLEG